MKKHQTPKLQVFRARSKTPSWGWRVTRGRNTATSGETFTRRRDAKRALRSFVDSLVGAFDGLRPVDYPIQFVE